MKTLCRILGMLSVLSLVACSDMGTDPIVETPTEPPIEPPPVPTVSFANDIQPVFAVNCVGCHGNSGGLSLKASGAYANLVNTTSFNYGPLVRVVPGKPEESVLYRKLSGDPTVGSSMPPSGPLDAATLELIRVWIAEGALNN
jgi:hypothetical protein